MVGDLWIELLEDNIKELKWTSQIGLVEGKVGEETSIRAINCKGISKGYLPIKPFKVFDNYIMCKSSEGQIITSIKQAINLDYQFWYY